MNAVSYFSTELDALLEELGVSRAAFADGVGVPASSFHNLINGRRPEVSAIEKICGALSPEQRANLVIAHLRDEIPPSAAEFVRLISLVAPLAKEMPDEPAIRLPKSVRADFDYLERMALKHPEVVDSIRSTVRILRDVEPAKGGGS
jgi:hypothetical protein